MINISFFSNIRVKKSINYFSKFLIFFTLLSSTVLAANYPLEVLQPQEDRDIKNRFYKAYPGLEYNVRMAVIGGKFPYYHELTSAPKGMKIDSRSGEITWPNPVESKTPYRVSARITDSEHVSRSANWTIRVTKKGFIFVDAVNGTPSALGGKGTIDDPWLSLKDVYGGDTYTDKNRSFRAGEFVYFRAGTYHMDGYVDGTNEGGGDGTRLTFRSDYKPQVWLAYPGDDMPIIQQDIAHLYFEGPGGDIWLDGLDFRSDGNVRAMGMNISSIKNNVVIRRNKFSGITGGYTGGNNALIFFRQWATGGRFAIQDNEFSGVDEGYGILNYRTNKVLVENNYFHDIGTHAVGMKVQSNRWDVRANLFRNNPHNSIWEYYADHAKSKTPSGDIEISFNIIEAGGGKLSVNEAFENNGLPIYVFRNTIMDGAFQNYVVETNGPFYWKNNVIISKSGPAEKIEMKNIKSPSRLIVTDNLTGVLADEMIDTRGNLTGASARFIGTHGHQVGNPPSPVVLRLEN